MPEPPSFEKFARSFPLGTVLFREGEAGLEMYVIQTGRVQITRRVRGRDTHLATLAAGEFFGEMALLNQQPRSASATVIEEAQLLVLDGKTFEAMVRGNSEIAMRFLKKMAARLAQANAQVETLLLHDLNHRVAHHLRRLAGQSGVADGTGTLIEASVEEIADQVGASGKDVAQCLKRLEEARLITMQLGGISVAEPGKLDQFVQFLQLKERYGE